MATISIPRRNIDVADDAVTAAQADVERLQALEERWSAELLDKGRQLHELRGSAGERAVAAALAGEDEAGVSRNVSGAIAELSDALEGLVRNIAAARHERRVAVERRYRAETDRLLARAAALRVEADEREVRTRELLDKLEAWEGCAFGPVRPDASRNPGSVVVTIPRTEALRLEADAFERDANRRHFQPTLDVEWHRAELDHAGDVDELLARLGIASA